MARLSSSKGIYSSSNYLNQMTLPHTYHTPVHKVQFKDVKLNSLFSYNGVKHRKIDSGSAKVEKTGEVINFFHQCTVTICENKYQAVTVYCDPKNYLSHRLERDEVHTLRFPSKYEYSVYCALKKYLNQVNKRHGVERFAIELQFQVTLVSKGVLLSAITHIVDFIIRDTESKVNPILYVEAKGKFLDEYVNKMKLMQGLKPNVYSRYVVVSNNEPPKSYQAYYISLDKLELFLNKMGVK